MGKTLTETELHVRHYWRVMQAGVTLVPLSDYQDELDTLALMTNSAVLKDACRRSIHRFDHIGRMAVAANG